MVKLSLLGDPVGRRLLGESARPSTVAAAYRALLSGDTDAFALVATWVLAGRALPAVSAADSPAAGFFRELLERTPAVERDRFLQLGLRGQLANRGILARSPRVPLSTDAATAARLVRYLAAFIGSTATAPPGVLVGEQLRHFASYPDPRLVRLAGALALPAALPHLERFLLLRRRFFHLRTDYSTRPEPTDALFIESLRAVVEIGQRNAAAPAAAVLQRVLQQAEREASPSRSGSPGTALALPASLAAQGEPILLESFDDNEGQAPPSRQVSERRLSPHDGVRDKRAWLTLAIAALGGSAPELAALHGANQERARPPLAGTAWSVACDSAQAGLSSTHLYLLTHLFIGGQHRPVLISLERTTGRTQFVVPLGPQDDSELSLVTHQLLVAADGAPVLLVSLRTPATGPRLLRFDPDTGEVSAAHPLAVSGRAEPVALLADASGYVLRRGPVVFRQREDGTLAWRWAVPPEASVAVGDGTAVALHGEQLRLRTENGESTLAVQRLLGRASAEGAFVLALAGGFAIADPTTKLLRTFDLQGTPGAQWPLAEGASSSSALQGPLAHRAVLARGQLQVLAPRGGLRTVAAPLNVSQVLVTDNAAYLGDSAALQEAPLDGTPSRRLPDAGHPHMARVLAATRDWIYVLTYADGYQVAALRRGSAP